MSPPIRCIPYPGHKPWWVYNMAPLENCGLGHCSDDVRHVCVEVDRHCRGGVGRHCRNDAKRDHDRALTLAAPGRAASRYIPGFWCLAAAYRCPPAARKFASASMECLAPKSRYYCTALA